MKKFLTMVLSMILLLTCSIYFGALVYGALWLAKQVVNWSCTLPVITILLVVMLIAKVLKDCAGEKV